MKSGRVPTMGHLKGLGGSVMVVKPETKGLTDDARRRRRRNFDAVIVVSFFVWD
jgi:hypothetical protein